MRCYMQRAYTQTRSVVHKQNAWHQHLRPRQPSRQSSPRTRPRTAHLQPDLEHDQGVGT